MHLPLMFRTVDREGFATALGNLAGDVLQSGVPTDVGDAAIPRGGAVVGQFGLRPSGILPEFVVVRDEDLQDTYAWVSAYFNGLTPITQWCRVWRQSEFGRLDFVSEIGLGSRLGAWIGAIVGELVDAEEGLGFLLQLGDFQYDTPMVFVAVFMLIALALVLYGIVMLLEKRFLKWQQKN